MPRPRLAATRTRPITREIADDGEVFFDRLYTGCSVLKLKASTESARKSSQLRKVLSRRFLSRPQIGYPQILWQPMLSGHEVFQQRPHRFHLDSPRDVGR